MADSGTWLTQRHHWQGETPLMEAAWLAGGDTSDRGDTACRRRHQ